LGQPVNDGIAPFRSFDLAADSLPDLPVELDERRVDSLEGPLAEAAMSPTISENASFSSLVERMLDEPGLAGSSIRRFQS
jgi:hypothetical protein